MRKCWLIFGLRNEVFSYKYVKNIKCVFNLINMIQSELKEMYKELFEKFEIDEKTGCLKNFPQIKFPTFPYIGSKYGESIKILIIGLDIGSDEKLGGIQSFEERREAIEDKIVSNHNPHIAGTYFTSLFFLRNDINFKSYWDKLKNELSCQKALQKINLLPKLNPLSYVALTNYYKFVSLKRKNRAGGENRNHIDKKIELDFFIKEVKLLDPDVIVFQSNLFNNKKNLLKELFKIQNNIYIGVHPAYRGKREPEYFIKQIKLLNSIS